MFSFVHVELKMIRIVLAKVNRGREYIYEDTTILAYHF